VNVLVLDGEPWDKLALPQSNEDRKAWKDWVDAMGRAGMSGFRLIADRELQHGDWQLHSHHVQLALWE
jgi:hypothetical protein